MSNCCNKQEEDPYLKEQKKQSKIRTCLDILNTDIDYREKELYGTASEYLIKYLKEKE